MKISFFFLDILLHLALGFGPRLVLSAIFGAFWSSLGMVNIHFAGTVAL
jgi:hypothetical protein